MNEKQKQAKEYFQRGYAYYYKGDYDKAIESYHKAIELKPDYAEAYYNQGNAYKNKGE
ncbi:MAG: tetratricopeptide repeat protein [Tannerella sp.]|jgi:tetratricopeptide (TPR) repeat protein|nr:tetratricopeptide repeat protein [Tannerella sp.]